MAIKKTRLALLGLVLLGGFTVVPAVAGDIYIIAHPSLSLSSEELKDVYMGEKQFAGPIKLAPTDNSAIQGDFLAKTLNLEASRYASLWIKKSFRGGLAAPLVKPSDAEVISYVKNTMGAVGYISTPPPQGVRQLYKY